MLKYKGKYRVVCEFDQRNLEPIKDDLYIACSKDGQIYRVDDCILAYSKPRRGNSEQFCEKLRGLGAKDIENRSSDGDVLIYFNEDSLDIIANEVGASQNGADISPSSVKNLRKLKWFKENKDYYVQNGYYKELSEKEKEVLRERFKNNVKG